MSMTRSAVAGAAGPARGRCRLLKLCGVTRLDDALRAVEAGATAVGFVLWPNSPRYIQPDRAAEIVAGLPEGVERVGVFVNEPVDSIRRIAVFAGLSMVQLHGEEPATYAAALEWPVLRSVTLDSAAAVGTRWPAPVTLLLDASDPVRRGGTGTLVDWDRAAGIARSRPLVLAGGLRPENVAAAIAAVRPSGVDVSSGVERSPGVKDAGRVGRFFRNAREAFDRMDDEPGSL